MSIAEIQDAPLAGVATIPQKQEYRDREINNQPHWPAYAKKLAVIIYHLDRGDTPNEAGCIGCYSSLDNLATEMGVSLSTVQRGLRWLKKEGVLFEIGHTTKGILFRRIILKWDVRARVYSKRKVSTVVNGQLVHRRLDKSELPIDIPYALKRLPSIVTGDYRMDSKSGIRNTPIIPLAGDGRILSDFQTGARNVPTATKPTAPKSNTPPAPKGRLYTQQLRANAEICDILKDHYPVEKQNDNDLRILGRKLKNNDITPAMLALALSVKDRLTDYDEGCKVIRICDFRHFLKSLKRLTFKATEGKRERMWSMLNEAKINLSYPEVRKQLGDEHGLDVDITDGICQGVEDLLFSLLAGGPGTQLPEDAQFLGNMTAGTFLKMKFNELKKEYLEAYPEEVLA